MEPFIAYGSVLLIVLLLVASSFSWLLYQPQRVTPLRRARKVNPLTPVDVVTGAVAGGGFTSPGTAATPAVD